jgi:glycosyltransferase involved in cell wall biosynthesis
MPVQDALPQLPAAPEAVADPGASTQVPSGRRLKVVQLTDRVGTHGGAERLTMQVAERLDPARFESIVCATRFSQEERERPTVEDSVHRLEEHGVRFVGLDRRVRADLLAWRPLYSLLRRERVDVVHAHKFGANVWGVVMGRLARVPVVITHEHGWTFEGEPLKRFLDRELIARGSNVFIAVSREDQRRMVEIERIKPDDTIFLPNGIPPLPPPAGNDVRAELGIPEGTPVAGTLGFLRFPKAMDNLVRAAASLKREIPEARVLIAGEGPDRPDLEALIDELDLHDTVTLLGLRRDVPDFLAALDVAVCPSDSEGSPLSVMEYMDAGLPVVSTRVGGVPDLIDEGVNGLMVPRRDPDALGSALARVLRDPEAGRRMGSSGRERRKREFDLDVMVRNLEGLYERLYGATKRGRREGFRPAAL